MLRLLMLRPPEVLVFPGLQAMRKCSRSCWNPKRLRLSPPSVLLGIISRLVHWYMFWVEIIPAKPNSRAPNGKIYDLSPKTTYENGSIRCLSDVMVRPDSLHWNIFSNEIFLDLALSPLWRRYKNGLTMYHRHLWGQVEVRKQEMKFQNSP